MTKVLTFDYPYNTDEMKIPNRKLVIARLIGEDYSINDDGSLTVSDEVLRVEQQLIKREESVKAADEYLYNGYLLNSSFDSYESFLQAMFGKENQIGATSERTRENQWLFYKEHSFSIDMLEARRALFRLLGYDYDSYRENGIRLSIEQNKPYYTDEYGVIQFDEEINKQALLT